MSKEDEFFSFLKNTKGRVIKEMTRQAELIAWVGEVGLDEAQRQRDAMNSAAEQLFHIADRTAAAYGTREMQIKVQSFVIKPFMSEMPEEIIEEIRFRILFLYYNGIEAQHIGGQVQARCMTIVRQIMANEANSPNLDGWASI